MKRVTEDETFLRNMAHEFEEGFNSGDVDRIMRFYADTYVDVNLRNPVQTKAERRRVLCPGYGASWNSSERATG